MEYTAENMAQLIVLAETLLRYKAINRDKFLNAMHIGFHSDADTLAFQNALTVVQGLRR